MPPPPIADFFWFFFQWKKRHPLRVSLKKRQTRGKKRKNGWGENKNIPKNGWAKNGNKFRGFVEPFIKNMVLEANIASLDVE